MLLCSTLVIFALLIFVKVNLFLVLILNLLSSIILNCSNTGPSQVTSPAVPGHVPIVNVRKTLHLSGLNVHATTWCFQDSIPRFLPPSEDDRTWPELRRSYPKRFLGMFRFSTSKGLCVWRPGFRVHEATKCWSHILHHHHRASHLPSSPKRFRRMFQLSTPDGALHVTGVKLRATAKMLSHVCETKALCNF